MKSVYKKERNQAKCFTETLEFSSFWVFFWFFIDFFLHFPVKKFYVLKKREELIAGDIIRIQNGCNKLKTLSIRRHVKIHFTILLQLTFCLLKLFLRYVLLRLLQTSFIAIKTYLTQYCRIEKSSKSRKLQQTQTFLFSTIDELMLLMCLST